MVLGYWVFKWVMGSLTLTSVYNLGCFLLSLSKEHIADKMLLGRCDGEKANQQQNLRCQPHIETFLLQVLSETEELLSVVAPL